jgi:hypothetical protein
MISDYNIFNNIHVKRFIAGTIDFGIEFGGGLLGGYFGAMMAALVIVLQEVSPAATQKAILTGMGSGFVFWYVIVSWVNRVLVQGFSRASIGKRFMELEIVSTGDPVSWAVMMKHWMSATLVGKISVVSSLDQTGMAPVLSIHSKPATTVGAMPAAASDESSDKKAA